MTTTKYSNGDIEVNMVDGITLIEHADGSVDCCDGGVLVLTELPNGDVIYHT